MSDEGRAIGHWMCDPCKRGEHEACVAKINDKDCCCAE